MNFFKNKIIKILFPSTLIPVPDLKFSNIFKVCDNYIYATDYI
jgi:hypothetical protein